MDSSSIDTCTVTDLRRHPSVCIARARELMPRPLFITRRGKPIAVLIPIEHYELMCRQLEELAAALSGDITPRVAALRGAIKDATVDEDDHRRYLEEKHS